VLQESTQALEPRHHRRMMVRTARIPIIHRIPPTPSILPIRNFCTKPSSVAVAPVESVAEVVNGPIRPSHGLRWLQLPQGSGPTPGEVCRTSPLELLQAMPISWRRSLQMRFITTLLPLQSTSTPATPLVDWHWFRWQPHQPQHRRVWQVAVPGLVQQLP
jgi:hypothetical protein